MGWPKSQKVPTRASATYRLTGTSLPPHHALTARRNRVSGALLSAVTPSVVPAPVVAALWYCFSVLPGGNRAPSPISQLGCSGPSCGAGSSPQLPGVSASRACAPGALGFWRPLWGAGPFSLRAYRPGKLPGPRAAPRATPCAPSIHTGAVRGKRPA